MTDLAFPSVTICSPGLNMEAVKEAIFKDFNQWRREEGKGSSKEEVDEYMEAKYAMKVGEGNIFDFIVDMMLPSVSSRSKNSVALVENLVSCEKSKGDKSKRRKRETSVILPPDCQLDEEIDYGGSSITSYPNDDDPSEAEDWKNCAVLCVEYLGAKGETCGYWTYLFKPKTCVVKAPDFHGSQDGQIPKRNKKYNPGATSGNMPCGLGEFFITQKYV